MSDVQTGGNAGSEGPLSAREAANELTQEQNAPPEKAQSQPVSQPQAAPEAPAVDESADAETGSPDGETTDEGQDQAPDPEVPAIDPPSSWTKDAQDRWAKLDRETQEYLATRDREDNAAIKRKFQEAEEQLKGLTAREQAIEQQRQQLEALSAAKLQDLQKQLQGEFSDIKDMSDVKKMAAEDPVRYLNWTVQQQDIATEMAIQREAQDRQAQQAQAQFVKFAEEQDKAFVQRMPEFADKDKADRLQKSARTTLKNIGFPDDELTQLWNGQKNFSFREARMQELIAKAARWDEAQEAKKAVVANKSLPPVQRPGVAQPGSNISSQIRDLEKLSRKSTGKAQLDIEAKIMALEQRARARQ